MRKKAKSIILIVALISLVAIFGVMLSACNSATAQGQLRSVVSFRTHSQETLVYDVVDEADPEYKGTYTVTLTAHHKGEAIKLGSRTYEGNDVQDGILIDGTLSYKDHLEQFGCYYKLVSGSTYMAPSYTYRLEKDASGTTVFEMQGTYNSKSLDVERTYGNDAPQRSSLGFSSSVYDNNQFQQVLRSVTTFSSGIAMSFSTPVATKNSLFVATTSVSGNNSVKVKNDFTASTDEFKEEGVSCIEVALSRSTEVNGASQLLYYALDSVKVNGWEIVCPLMKIVEPYKSNGKILKVTYSLKSISIE